MPIAQSEILDADLADELAPEPVDDMDGGEEAHAAEVARTPHGDALAAHARWKESPSPQRMADVLRTVKPIVDRTVARYPRYNAAVLGGEAKRLAIGAIKTFDPAQGVALSTHVFNHLRPLARNSANLGKAVDLSRLERERAARYLSGNAELKELHGREPSDAELRDHLKVSAKDLTKFRLAARGEVAESQAEYLPGTEDDGGDAARLRLWSDYVYHDLNPRDKQVMDLAMGRNGHGVHDGAMIAQKLSITPAYANRRREWIGRRILEGVNSMNQHVEEETE